MVVNGDVCTNSVNHRPHIPAHSDTQLKLSTVTPIDGANSSKMASAFFPPVRLQVGPVQTTTLLPLSSGSACRQVDTDDDFVQRLTNALQDAAERRRSASLMFIRDEQTVIAIPPSSRFGSTSRPLPIAPYKFDEDGIFIYETRWLGFFWVSVVTYASLGTYARLYKLHVYVIN